MSRVFVRGAIGFRTKNGLRNCTGTVVSTGQVQNEPPPPSALAVESKAKYPPILDLSRLAKYERKRVEWENDVKKLKTVEEKLIKVNMPRFYGWKCVIVKDGDVPIQTLDHFQQVTKTQMIVQDSLPDSYLPLAAAAEYHTQQLRPKIEEAIFIEHQGIKRNFTYEKEVSEKIQNEKFISKSFLRQVNRILLNYLSSIVPHLAETHMDVNPRFESFWIVGGLHPPKSVRYKRYHVSWIDDKEEINSPIDRYYQTICTPVLSLRNKQPLDPILTKTEVNNLEYDVPYSRYAPETLGIQQAYRHGTCIPGFWPGHTHEFGSIAYYTREYLVDIPDAFSEEDKLDKLHINGILSSFGWLNSLACYQGFSTYNDITYPLTTQTIISNGQYWSFYTYQLNTLLMNGKYIEDESSKNICYATNPLKLFDGIDADGKIIGFNEEVLKILLQYYLNPPKERENVVMKPYLKKGIHYNANLNGEERRIWVEDFYKRIASNRPRMALPYEIYDWERIYKIKFKTRPLEARRRPFELGQNPFNKPMDDHKLKYVPKVLRVGSYKDRKFRRNYYP